MACPVCGGRTVPFAVPADLRTYAPESSAHAALCSVCLRTVPADEGPSDPTFEAVHESFPSGEAGAALALALGLLDSLALRRDAIDDCCSYAEWAGADVLLTLDRLAGETELDPHFDAERRRHQLAEMLR
jgi:membrane-associated phospholipid phosphatase